MNHISAEYKSAEFFKMLILFGLIPECISAEEIFYIKIGEQLKIWF